MNRLLLVWLVLWAVPAAAAPVRVADDAGQVLELPRSPQRIVTLTPHLTELLFAVGAGPQVVGADTASDFPDAAKTLPRVGDTQRINHERILALKPDLVVVWVGGNRAADLHRLRQLGLPLLHTEARQLSDVPRLLRLVGQASGHAAAGQAAAQDFEARLAALRVPAMHQPPARAFYQVWDRPLMTVGGRHWISDALTICGVRNVFADLDSAAPVVSREAVLQRAPELIVSGHDASDPRGTWQAYARLPAVQRDAFVRVDADRLHRPTPRLIEGIAELCRGVAPYAR
ncbi:MAG: cobalamin-binding protein [Gammaproteobacteria bacterium]